MGSATRMNKRCFLPVLALGVLLALLFAVSASAGSLLECKGELPGGYTFTGPEEITVTIDVRNDGATLQFNIDGDQQQVNTADITAPAMPAAVRMRLAGKIE